ncbi:hypothetical protein, partial [Amycolatopsis sp. M39]|uniref:hypothetical protein n=1 Tax=Amycolatopsis sp. M39 TaxID=1825094 RepID=UPI001E59CF72
RRSLASSLGLLPLSGDCLLKPVSTPARALPLDGDFLRTLARHGRSARRPLATIVGARCPVPGARCPVPGARCPVPGFAWLVTASL